MTNKEKWSVWMEGKSARAPKGVLKLPVTAEFFFGQLRSIMEKTPLENIPHILNMMTSPLDVPPFIWFQAALEFPALRQYLHDAMLAAKATLPSPTGRYFFMIDVSEPAQRTIHERSLVRHMDVAAAVAAMAKTDDTPIYTVSNLAEPIMRQAHGLGFIDLVACSQPASDRKLTEAMKVLSQAHPDRLGLVFDGRDDDFKPASEIFFNPIRAVTSAG